VIVECNGEEDENHSAIAKVVKLREGGRLGVLWTYHPHSSNLANNLKFGGREILLSDHKDVVERMFTRGFA